MTTDHARVRSEVTDPARGFSLLRGFYSPDEVDWFRERSDALLANGPVMHAHIVHDRRADYVLPRAPDGVLEGYQVFQFPHNHRGTEMDEFCSRAIDFRNEVESQWADDVYRGLTADLRDYVQINYFPEGTGRLGRHIDQNPDWSSLLLQPWIPLSEPGEDYTAGNLIIHSKDGSSHAIEDELEVHRGDLVLFDRSLVHEVDAPAPGTGANRGRCNVVMGARQEPSSRLSSAYRRVFFTLPVFSATWVVKRWRRRLRAAAARNPHLGRHTPAGWRTAVEPDPADAYTPRAHADLATLGLDGDVARPIDIPHEATTAHR